MSQIGSAPASPANSLFDRLADPPGRVAGAVWAFVALAMMLVGVVLVPAVVVGVLSETDQVSLVRWLLGGNILALLAFLPLLRAVHAVIDIRAVPSWAVVAAYAVLLIRPLTLVPEVLAAPGSVLSNLGWLSPLLPYLLIASTGVAAGLAAGAVLPLAQQAVSTGRRAAVAAAVGLLVALALYSFGPYLTPLSALGVGVALLIRGGRSGRSDPANGPAGQH